MARCAGDYDNDGKLDSFFSQWCSLQSDRKEPSQRNQSEILESSLPSESDATFEDVTERRAPGRGLRDTVELPARDPAIYA